MQISRISVILIGFLILLGIMGLAYMTVLPGFLQKSMNPVDSDFEYPFEKDYQNMNFESNGEKIYYTGVNESGKLIDFDGGPHWLYAYGGGCASCHGADGKSGVPVMMSPIVPPDIRYQTLSSGQQHMNHVPYTEETLKVAITEGIDSEGLPLDLAMPRWEMSDSDLNDLIDCLKTL